MWLPLALLVVLGACAPQASRPFSTPGYGGPRPAPEAPRARVALLLPLSGPQAPLGRAMLQAAELALFEHGGPAVEFVPRDTGGTASGAAAAARAAISEGARYLVGPLTASETSAVSGPARSGRVPVLAFTNDSAQAGQGVWTLGVTPGQQVRRVVEAAAGAGARRFGLAAPDDAFGRRLAEAMRAVTAEAGLPSPVIVLHSSRADLATVAQQLVSQAGGEPLDAVLIGSAGARARAAAAALVAAGLPVPPARLLGHALWAQDAGLANEPALVGAWFAAPDPQARGNFEGRFLSTFGEQPPRIAGVAYDAAGLAARAASGNGPGYLSSDLFFGAEGPMRLLPDGQVMRGLAVYQVSPSGEPTVVEPAPVPALTGF